MNDKGCYEVIEPVDRNRELVKELVDLKMSSVRHTIINFVDTPETFDLPKLLTLKRTMDKWIREFEQITGEKQK